MKKFFYLLILSFSLFFLNIQASELKDGNPVELKVTLGDVDQICNTLGGCDDYMRSWLESVISQKTKIYKEQSGHWVTGKGNYPNQPRLFIKFAVSKSQMFNSPQWSVGAADLDKVFSNNKLLIEGCNGKIKDYSKTQPSSSSLVKDVTMKDDCVLLLEKDKLVNAQFITAFKNKENNIVAQESSEPIKLEKTQLAVTEGDVDQICKTLGGCDDYLKDWIKSLITQKPKIFFESGWSIKARSFNTLAVSGSQMFNRPNWGISGFTKDQEGSLKGCNGDLNQKNLFPTYLSRLKVRNTNPALIKDDCVVLLEKDKLVNAQFITAFKNKENNIVAQESSEPIKLEKPQLTVTVGDLDQICKTLGGCNKYVKSYLRAVISQTPKIYLEGNYSINHRTYKYFAVSESQMFNNPNWAASVLESKSIVGCNGSKNFYQGSPSYLSKKKHIYSDPLKKDDCILLFDKNKIVNAQFIDAFQNPSNEIAIKNIEKEKIAIIQPVISIEKPIINEEIKIEENLIAALPKLENKTIKPIILPEIKIDESPPVLVIDDYIQIYGSLFNIVGKVTDKSKVFVEVDGISFPIINDEFIIEGYATIGKQELSVIAIDQWGNRVDKNITVERSIQVAKEINQFDKLNPNKVILKQKSNKIALVIGIEEYANISNANYANRDAQYFNDYLQNALGVPSSNIKFAFNSDAKRSLKFEIKKWLKKNINSDTEVYVFFSGHGIAKNNGKDLYLLTNDTLPDFIEDSSIKRNEIFNDIAQYKPKYVNVFLDTCYSGAGRADGELLLAMAKGLVVVDENEQKLPDNFTLFTAASAQESAWSLPAVKHGIFSYFLMKGMEGDADLNQDKALTNGELQKYLTLNIARHGENKQTPQMIGNYDKILIRFE